MLYGDEEINQMCIFFPPELSGSSSYMQFQQGLGEYYIALHYLLSHQKETTQTTF